MTDAVIPLVHVCVCVHAVNIYHQLSYAREDQPDGKSKVEKGKEERGKLPHYDLAELRVTSSQCF